HVSDVGGGNVGNIHLYKRGRFQNVTEIVKFVLFVVSYIQARRRIQRNMIKGVKAISTRVRTKAIEPVQMPREGSTGWKKFMPKKPVMNVNGMKRVVMMVSVFITSFMRLLTAARYSSNALPTRSRRPSTRS